MLKSAGYTTGIFGKWHLGDEAAYQPDRRGFDEVFIHGGGGIGQTYPGSCGDAPGNTYFDPAILHNGTFEKTKGYCTDVFFGQAPELDRGGRRASSRSSATSRPTPRTRRCRSGPRTRRRYAGKVPDPNVAKFFGMIANIDDNVGRLLAKLKEWGIERDTLVIFMNDNGGTAGVKRLQRRHARRRRSRPGWAARAAASFWRWPGTLKPASTWTGSPPTSTSSRPSPSSPARS